MKRKAGEVANKLKGKVAGAGDAAGIAKDQQEELVEQLSKQLQVLLAKQRKVSKTESSKGHSLLQSA